MATLPQLIEDDVQRIDETLRELLASADGTAALVIDKGGFLITHQGDARDFDLTTIAALSSETNFNSTYQQGEKFSLFVINVDDNCMLVVIFKSQTGVGVVKYYAATAIKRIACQLSIAQERAPGAGFDLSVLNVADSESVFRKK
jgi:predicted regulator of Ras-like GTPase activity (Roadblock/LC7/MglB family)